MDRGAWRATVHGVAESQIQLSDYHSPYSWGRKTQYHKDVHFLQIYRFVEIPIKIGIWLFMELHMLNLTCL